MKAKSSPTTRRRPQRTTRRSVVIADRLSRQLIRVGGIATILAVGGVFFFLVWVTFPLFLPARVDEVHDVEADWDASSSPLHLSVDEHQTLGWVLRRDGTVEVFRLDNGETRHREELFTAGELASASFLLSEPLAVFGLADGSIRTGTIEISSRILPGSEFPGDVRSALENAADGTVANIAGGVAEATPSGLRRKELRVELGEPMPIASGPIRRIRHAMTPDGLLIVALAEPPAAEPGAPYRLVAVLGEERADFLTGRTSRVFGEAVELPFAALAPGLPEHLEISGTGKDILVGWTSGELFRLEAPRLDEAFIAQLGRLVGAGSRLTSMAFLLGNRTLVWGDSTGTVRGGFLVRTSDYAGATIDGLDTDARARRLLIAAKDLGQRQGTAVSALAPSSRSRLLLTGFDDGSIRLSNVTNETHLARVALGSGRERRPSVSRLLVTPKEDGLLAVAGGRIYHAAFDPGHPEAGLRALLRPVWYEGYNEPQHLWQSSGGSDDFEPKLGLYPLVFGTVKATFYSMLFGAPLAILAAIFTSELLHRRAKAVIKPAIELMASLPSVVLGFLAALVFAPFVEGVLPALLTLFFTLPVTFLAAAYLWQMAPPELTLRFERWRIAAIALVAPLGFIAAAAAGPALERLFFSGNLKAWLSWDGSPQTAARFADATGGWMLVLLPVSALVVAWSSSRYLAPVLRARGSRWSRRRHASYEAVKFLLATAAAVLLALALSALLDLVGFDPRGSYLATYEQRNALVVGFAMAFAVIPIIYTIAEDALSTVPDHLRSASLGAGATTWQTATRIVVPTAMSGLFSAFMIGLGRAVGETMIVLMAAGNTPVLEWNVFEGFRTLSANIAVELPEAAKDSTHYRTLFLAALLLFFMTFVVNTVAEVVRQRFRRRAFQL